MKEAAQDSIAWSQLFRWATGIGVFALVSRCTGLAREASIAYFMGASTGLDAYFLASAIPLFVAWVGDASANQTVLPLFTRASESCGPEEKWRLAAGLLWLCVLAMAVMVTLGAFLAPVLWQLVAGDLLDVSTGLGTLMVLLSLPVMIVQSIGGWETGILHSRKRFFIPAALPVAYNACIIGFLFCFAARWGIYALALGMLAAEAVRVCVQIVPLRTLGMRSFHFLNPDIKGATRYLAHFFPIALVAAFQQFLFILDRLMARGLSEGSVSSLAYGHRLLVLPFSLLVATLATPLFSVHADLAAKQDYRRMRSWLLGGLRLLVFLALPLSVGTFLLREPIIRLLYQRGAFETQAAILTAKTVAGYAFGLLFWTCLPLLGQFFYSLGEVRTPLVAGSLALLTNLLLNWLFKPMLGLSGIALATTLSLAVAVIAHFPKLIKHIGNVGGDIRMLVAKACLFGTFITAAMVCLMSACRGILDPNSSLHALIQLLVVGGPSGLICVAFWRIWKK